jgi:hypothetical protein
MSEIFAVSDDGNGGSHLGVDARFASADLEESPTSMALAEGTWSPEGGLFGGLIDVLQRLGDGQVLSSTARQAEQLGHVLQGARLSDEEIDALPKVRFERAEEQSCAICLEPYEQGMLLTRLSCDHYFHPVCLARWMRRATRCPLCRADQDRAAGPEAELAPVGEDGDTDP